MLVDRTQFQHQDNLVPWKLKGEGEEEEKVRIHFQSSLIFLSRRCYFDTTVYHTTMYYPVFHPLLLSPDLQAYRRGGTLPSLPSVPPRSSPFFRAQHSFEPPSSTTTSREEARDLLGRDTKEISAGLSQLPSQLI